jgi:hypothetical protein
MEAGIENHVWSIEEMVKLLDGRSILYGLQKIAYICAPVQFCQFSPYGLRFIRRKEKQKRRMEELSK